MAETRRRYGASRALVVGLACASAIALAACSGGSEQADGTTASAPAPSESREPATVPTPPRDELPDEPQERSGATPTAASEPDQSPDPASRGSLPLPTESFEAGAAQSAPAVPVAAEDLLLIPDELLAAGTFPKGPFGEQTTVDQGPLAYAVFDTTKPPRCTDMVSGPFAGTAPDASGPIQVSAQRLFQESDPGTYIGAPVMIIQSVQVFSDAQAAAQAFGAIAAAAPQCRSFSYDDGYGVIERAWKEVDVTGPGGPQPYTNTIVMLDKRVGRVIGLAGTTVWGISVSSGHAMEKDEIRRLEDLIELARTRLGGGGLG